mgnify:CR=1 FL=1
MMGLPSSGLPSSPAMSALPAHVQEALGRYARTAQGAYADSTVRALRADMTVFASWCIERDLACLPAAPETVARFVDEKAGARAPATVRRYVASIAHLHRAGEVSDPTKTMPVRHALRRMHRTHGRRQEQAPGLTLELRNRLIDHAPATLRGLRDAALLAVAYDTLLRRSELVALDARDLDRGPDGSATLLVRRAKTDQEGEGTVTWLAPDTVQFVDAWTKAAGIVDGPLFRSVRKGDRVGGALAARDVARIYKSMAVDARLTADIAAAFSGHSPRVGAAQDMSAAGLELAEIMQAGRWRTSTMVARYTERVAARRGGAAKLAILQNRF